VFASHLLAHASQVLVAGRADAVADLRSMLTALLARIGRPTHLSVLLTGAPPTLCPTVATLKRWSARVGAPVRAVVPAIVPGTADPAVDAAVAALARALVGCRIGLALGAGGARGFAHVGVLRALRRAGVPLDCVAGTSIGALVGAGIAMDASPDWLLGALHASVPHIFRPTVPLRGMLTNRALGAYLRRDEVCGLRVIEDLPLPFAVSAADLIEGREIVIRRGPIWQALLASAAIPGIYPPVRIGRHWLVDGGVINPVPVSIARLLGADVVIAVDLSEPLAPRQEADMAESVTAHCPPLPATILRARDIMMAEMRAHSIGEQSVLVRPNGMEPTPKSRIRGFALRNFDAGTRFVDAGEVATEEILPRLRQRLPWLR
jgi:NTE family protein